MKARRFLLTCLTAAFIALPVRAEAAATLPASIRSTNNAQVARGSIVPLLDKLVAALKAGEATAGQQIVDEVLPAAAAAPGAPAAPVVNPGAGAGAPSGPFLDAYAQVLNEKLMELVNDPNPRIRLNAAIVAARVAERANNARLVPAIVDLLDDPHEAVVHWAIKGTKGLIGPAHTAAAGVQGSKLMPAFVAAAKKQVASGPTIKVAYEALDEAKKANTPAPAVKAAVDAMQELLEARRNLYVKALPEFPSNENIAISFLSAQGIWRAQTPPQQFRTIQLISDMASLISQRYGQGGAIERAEMAAMLKVTGGALSVIGTWTDAASKMDAFARPLAQVTPIAAPERVADLVKATYPGLTGFTAWKDLKPPPTIE